MNINEMANYCLNCKTKPCTKSCPLGNEIPAFISCIKEGNMNEAYNILTSTTLLPSICGRICPHSQQCEGSCVRGIKGAPVSIGELEAFVGDYALKNNIKYNKTNSNNKSVAVVGSGPAGLTAAGFLAKEGYNVSIFEKESYLGGLLIHGIPEFRLEKELVNEAIQNILDLGISVNLNYTKVDDLHDKFDAVILSFGANESIKLNVPGEELKGVYGANKLLKTQEHPDYTNKSVIVIGGGNVAMDAARTVNRLGAKNTTVIYRRAKEHMPAEKKEIEFAENENIRFIFQASPTKVVGDNSVKGIECIKTEIIKSEDGSRDMVKAIDNSNFIINADYIIVAIGSTTNKELIKKLNLETDKNGYIKIDENNMSSEKDTFIAGDLTGIKSTVAWACRSGRDTAYSVIRYLDFKQ